MHKIQYSNQMNFNSKKIFKIRFYIDKLFSLYLIHTHNFGPY